MVTFPEVYCYLIETSGDFAGKAENIQLCEIVISGWVKPLQVVKRNSGYDSHYATSPSSYFPHPPSDFCPSPFLMRVWVSPWKNCVIKDVCRYVLEHFDGLMRVIIFP